MLLMVMHFLVGTVGDAVIGAADGAIVVGASDSDSVAIVLLLVLLLVALP